MIFSALKLNADCFPCILINGNSGTHKGECVNNSTDLGEVFLGFTDIFLYLGKTVKEITELEKINIGMYKYLLSYYL